MTKEAGEPTTSESEGSGAGDRKGVTVMMTDETRPM